MSEKNKEGNGRQFISLKGRLFILLVVMILPFIAFSIFKASDINKTLEKEYKTTSLNTAKSIAHDVDEYIIATGEVLIPIANSKDVRTQNYPAVSRWLQEFVPKYPYYHLIAFVDNNGFVKAVGMSDIMLKSEDAKKVNVKDTACYARGIVAPGVSVGDFMYSKLTGMPVVHVTYPVFDYSGKRIGFVAAAFDLTRIQNKLLKEKMPKHTVITLIDDKGVIIARSSKPNEYVGKKVSDIRLFKEMIGKKQGTSKVSYTNGLSSIDAFAVAEKVPWYIRVSVDTRFIQSQVKSQLINHYSVFIPLLLIALFGWLWIGRDVDRLHKKTEQLTLIDPLTGLWNCRKLSQDFKRELERARRYKEQVSFAMIDIDHFKHYNDTNGHQLGDDALCEVARIIKEAVRESDLVYRYGGEEMCVLLPNTDKTGASYVAKRIRSAVEQTKFIGAERQPEGRLTVSIGVSTYPYDSISKEGIIKCADIALYKAKNNGRNRVEFYSEEDISTTIGKERPKSKHFCV